MASTRLLWVISAMIVAVKCTNYLDVESDEVFTSKGYPSFTKLSDKWSINNRELGGAVLVECSVKFKGNNGDCDKASLTFYDGLERETLCNNRTKFTYHSRFKGLEVELSIKSGEALLTCNNTAMPYGRPYSGNTEIPRKVAKILEPIVVDIIINENETNNNINGNLTSNLHNKYRFKCGLNRNILMKCQMQVHAKADPKRRCESYRFSAYSGYRVRWQCQTDLFFTFISQNEILNVTIDTGNDVKGYIKCDIKSIKKIEHSRYKNVVFEEVDSSEYGQRHVSGPKKTNCDCGWSNKATERIIFGKDTAKHEFPWSVSLQTKASKSHFCGGSIITPFHIITAAHCITGKSPQQIVAVMGTNNKTDGRISSVVKKIYKHNYNMKTYINDIAILELETKINYTQYVGPVCLPTRNLQLAGQFVTAMGWGRLDKSEYAAKDPNIMKKTTLRIIDIESCSIDWEFLWDIKNPKVICTWSKRSDICIGDSGGPVVWHDSEVNRYTLVGLPALCDKCILSLPSVHTAVHDFYDWIVQTIAKSVNPMAKEAKVCAKID